MSARDFSENDMLRVLRGARDTYRFYTSSLRFNHAALQSLDSADDLGKIKFDAMPDHVSPPEPWRLTVDDGIDFLIRTGRAKIGDDRFFFGDQGPYYFSRDFMRIFLGKFENHAGVRNDVMADVLLYLEDQLTSTRERLLDLTKVNWGKFIGPKALPHSPIHPWHVGAEAVANIERQQWRAIKACMDDLNRAFAATVRLQDLVGARLEAIPHRSGPGRRASEVRREFVRHVARLYELLTGSWPASSPDSPFADFVESAWNSMADDAPAVSFQRTIAEVCGQKNSARPKL